MSVVGVLVTRAVVQMLRNFFGQGLDVFYVNSVNVTRCTPHQQIWTFAAGVSERSDTFPLSGCFCGDTKTTLATPPPPFVRVDYFCESGNPCLLYTSPSPRDATLSRMPSSA